MSELLSRGNFRDIEYTWHPIADGRDSWACKDCGHVVYDDTLLSDDELCKDCEAAKDI